MIIPDFPDYNHFCAFMARIIHGGFIWSSGVEPFWPHLYYHYNSLATTWSANDPCPNGYEDTLQTIKRAILQAAGIVKLTELDHLLYQFAYFKHLELTEND